MNWDALLLSILATAFLGTVYAIGYATGKRDTLKEHLKMLQDTEWMMKKAVDVLEDVNKKLKEAKKIENLEIYSNNK